MATVSSRENPEAYFYPIRSRLQDVLGDALDALCLTQPKVVQRKPWLLWGTSARRGLQKPIRHQFIIECRCSVASSRVVHKWMDCRTTKINDLIAELLSGTIGAQRRSSQVRKLAQGSCRCACQVAG